MAVTRPSPLLAVRDLHVRLPTPRGPAHVLRGLDFELARGQTLGLIGESGCGKSMTALAVMGLLPEQAAVQGSIHLDGQVLTSASPAAWQAVRGRKVAMMFQEPMTALNPVHRIGDQIAEPLRLHQGLPAQAARAQALRLLEKVRMPQAAQRLDAYPHQLSGGQRQRVMLAAALACGPQLLLADEPTTALDASLQREVLNLIDELVRDDGMALVLISHDLAAVAQRVQRVAVMYAGRIVELGPTATLFATPAHPYTQRLQAARPRLGARLGEHVHRGDRAGATPTSRPRLTTIPGRPPDLVSDDGGCAFAPRCALVVAACHDQVPALRGRAPDSLGHAAACVHDTLAP
jgi:peptide/nickel transport system ATP-binding protein